MKTERLFLICAFVAGGLFAPISVCALENADRPALSAGNGNGNAEAVVGTRISIASEEGVLVQYVVTSVEEGARTVAVGTGSQAIDRTATGVLTIPASIAYGGKDYAVQSVSAYAFSRCAISSIRIPNNVASIGGWAFYDNKMKEIHLPEGLQSIGKKAFENCDSLRSIVIPDNVTSLEEHMFYGCDSLQRVHLGTGLASIGPSAFYRCVALEEVTGGEAVASIGESAFAQCSSLTRFNCHDKVTKLNVGVFERCRNLKELKGLKAVTHVARNALQHAVALRSLEMGENLVSWDSQQNNYGSELSELQSISLPGRTIPFTQSSSIYGLPKGMILYVPADLVDLYAANSAINSKFRIIPQGMVSDFAVETTNGGELQERLQTAGITPSAAHSLTVRGPINGTDIEYIHRYLVNLRILNLQDARIVNGGDSYHHWTIAHNGTATQDGSNSYNTENNIVGMRMFAYMTALEKLTLPTEVTTIKGYAFSDCPRLQEVVIPETVDSIGDRVFSSERTSISNRIVSLVLPSKLKTIQPGTFQGMKYLQSIAIPDSVTSIGEDAFRNCDALRTVVMGNKLTHINRNAFYNCKNLRNINVSEKLVMVGGFAFADCDALVEILFPQSLNQLGEKAFYGCDALEKVVLPQEMESIGSSVFQDSRKLAEVEMPETLGSMGTHVFADCKSLRSLVLPESITNIPSHTFSGCTSLVDIQLSSETSRISSSAFLACSSLSAFDFGRYTKLSQLYEYSFSQTGLKEVDLPEHVDLLSSNAFYGCKSLKKANIPSRVDHVPSGLFLNCSVLDTVILHDGIRRVNSSAFAHCTMLPTLNLNDAIIEIASSAFSGCDSLRLEKLPDALEKIGNSAFYHCDMLALDKLPAGLKIIESSAFSSCISLKVDSLPAGLTALYGSAFSRSGIKKMRLPEGIQTWGSHIFYNCTSLTEVVWPKDKTTIPVSTFNGCTNLADPQLPNEVTTIGTEAFAYCNFTNFTFPASLQTIESSAFKYTRGLSDIELPARLKTIGNYAFQGSHLRHIEIPDSVTTLGVKAFANCDSLRTAYLGRNMNYYTNSDHFSYFDQCAKLEVLRVFAGTPPTINYASYITAYYKKCALEVPAGVEHLYLAANHWKDFKEIRSFLNGEKLHPDDFAVMKALYQQWGGEHWTNKWDLTTDDCFIGKWYGVTTSGERIVKIQMTDNNLRGELTQTVFALSELTSLNLENNHLTGEIHQILADGYRNEKLTSLTLQGNELEGDAYPFVSKFPNLTYLNLAYNRLTAMSQPYPKTNISSVSSGFWLTGQFLDYSTHEPVVTEKYPAQEVTLGIPFRLEFNSLQRYNHAGQNYNRNTSFLFRWYWDSQSNHFKSDYYAHFRKNAEGLYELYATRQLLFKQKKNTPVAICPHYNDYTVNLAPDATPSILSFNWIDGDVNADQSVDVTDLQKVIYYALNDAAPANAFYNFTSADGNDDNGLDVRDAVISVNRILDFDEEETPAGVRALYNKERREARNHFAIEQGVVRMANRDEVAAIQLTLTDALAEDITISPTLSGFQLAKKQLGDHVRVILYSMTERTLPEGEWDLIRGLDNASAILSVRLSDVETNHLDASIRSSLTGLDDIRANASEMEIHDLSGRRVTNLQKGGFYIVNKKKTIIK